MNSPEGHRRQAARRGAVGAAAVILAGAGVAGCTANRDEGRPSSRTAAWSVAQSTSARSAITHDLSFDGGALRVSPAAHAPAVGEARAISLFRSTGPEAELVQDVSIGYGEVTLKAGLAGGWRERAAWVVVYQNGPHGCTNITGPQPGREGRHVFILDSTNGEDALSYQEAGPRCGFPSGPTVQVAQQYVSLPWIRVGYANGSVTVRYRYQDCTGDWPGTLTARGTVEQPQPEVVFPRPMKAGRCGPGAAHTNTVDLRPGAVEIGHAPTGPVTGIYTSLDPNRFDTPASLT